MSANKRTLVDLFRNQVEKTPDHIAVTYGNQAITYHTLHQQVNILAARLQLKGVRPGSLIPLCVERSIEMVVGILGILKAGAAYVPIDPHYPLDRINLMLGDIGHTPVLVDGATGGLFAGGDHTVIEIGSIFNESVIENGRMPEEVPLSPADLAYIIYTSGSTGRPKGVMIEHQSIVHYIESQAALLKITADERILQSSNFSFDASIEQLFLALSTGATLVLLPPELQLDMNGLSSFLDENRITHLHGTPAFLQQIPARKYLSLKRVISAGETCRHQLVAKWINFVEFINKYGPTETTISVSEYFCTSADKDRPDSIPIGQPLPDTPIFILDENCRPVAAGVIGELHVGGLQVARGYLNLPQVTEERFVVYKDLYPTRLYRTGDLVKQLPDGNLVYCGRIDDQVKIRGHRVEIGEIEYTIDQHPSISQCCVSVDTDANGNQRLIAYVVPATGFDQESLSNHLQAKLPDYMLPYIIIPLPELPITANGKIDKLRLPFPDVASLLADRYEAPRHRTENLLVALWQSTLNVRKVGIHDNFFQLGGNSLLAIKITSLLASEHGLSVSVTKLYQYPTIAKLATFIDGETAFPAFKTPVDKSGFGDDVAIVGMAGRFPGADSVDKLWELLQEGREGIQFFTAEDLDISIPAELRNHTDYVKARGIIRDVDQFDAAFFGIHPKLAELMDPQQRVFLEIAWEALEQSGHVPQKYDGRIGIYAGCRYNTYYVNNVLAHPDLVEKAGTFQVTTVNDKDYIASRTAYTLDLKGPSVTVQSACSTSLLAIAQAVEGIRNGLCDVALAGGASISPPIHSGHLHEEGAILSKDGHCKPFDVDATGTVFSDGAGVVVLKNRQLAEQDGDTIYAVIKGIGISNDGADKGSFTAPSATGQATAIRMAIDDAQVDPATLSYIEAHGTATPLGDPIEIEGLLLAFGHQEQKQYCTIGSIKSNLGHLTNASGVAGLIKTALALHHRKLLPTVHYTHSNPHINFKDSPFIVNTTLKDWESEQVRRAGVSSFGVGGTNVHVVLEEASVAICQPSESHKPVHLISWSAKSEVSAVRYGEQLASFVRQTPQLSIADLAYTLHTARQDFKQRTFCLASDAAELNRLLAAGLPNPVKKMDTPVRDLVFMFPGQGAQFINMGNELYRHEPVFKQALDTCAELLQATIGVDIRNIIYPAEYTEAAKAKLTNTRYSQPALFCIEYALAKLWMSWGASPSALIGHSIGEFVAAHLAGIFSLEDALKLIAERARLMADLPAGSMLSVRASVDEVKQLLPPDVDIAAVNSPKLCVVAGPSASIASFADQLNVRTIANRLLQTSHAFHSHLMEPVVAPYKAFIERIPLHRPMLPIVSTVTGNWLKDGEAMDPNYWASHLRATVQFSDAAQVLLQHQPYAFIEVGPGVTTATLIRQQTVAKPALAVTSLEVGDPDTSGYRTLLNALGKLWQHGFEPDWRAFYQTEKRSKLSTVPTYAYNRKRYWVDAKPSNQTEAVSYEGGKQNGFIQHTDIKLEKPIMRKQTLVNKLRELLEDISGIEMQQADTSTTFIEIGLDSLLLTQIALLLKKEFGLPITFRQLNEDYDTLDRLATYLDLQLPAEVAAPPTAAVAAPSVTTPLAPSLPTPAYAGSNDTAIDLISQQLQLLSKQLQLLQSGRTPTTVPGDTVAPIACTQVFQAPQVENTADVPADLNKPFGAGAKIEKQVTALTSKQRAYIDQLSQTYNEKTKGSKAYTQKHRPHMADPRVVSGFRPATKELVYSVVVNRSKGSRLWDIDGNEYIDLLNGFGSNMLGYQPDFIKEALHDQIERGYEIGPQHELSGEVCQLVCEFTGFERAALCNTGSEAVLGAMRIARTVTGRSIIVSFTGSYHGITDEVIVRGSKKLKTFPAAPGIQAEAVQNMLVLDYNSEESLRIIKERGAEIAAVLVEPIQSRHAEVQPIDFLKKLRKITEESGTVLVFDEVISGFRFHPGGIQSLFGIRADIGTYGKVAGGGISIGIIAGKKQYMDALDGGFWQYGDDSIPEVGVTYFAGTFVRHPLALAATKASLTYLKEQGPELQESLNETTTKLVSQLNQLCQRYQVPMFIAQFGSQWRIKFKEEYPYAELFFTLMRLKGIHVLEGFSCFLTTAHTPQDIDVVIRTFEESLVELKNAELIPTYQHEVSNDNHEQENTQTKFSTPPLPNARLGRDKDGNPAWFIKDEENPGKYLQIN